ncbi:glucans biosynthesis protein G, partial [mine drainage metagenome]
MRPRQNAHHMVIDALLNGPSVAGAYRFTIRPGQATQIKMRVRLFFRHAPRVLGIAPLTSMFFYGAGTPRPVGEWRPAVHDSDGLELANGNGEWIWRPLINPPRFQVTSFQLDNPRGFGLMQRDQRFSGYEDLGARYDT